MENHRMLGVIPARYASSRFPGKPLVDILGKTMIQRVYEQAKQASCLEEVVVATDDQRIFQAVQAFGGKVVMTRSDHLSGTDRVGEVAQQMAEYSHIINIQGDEPFIDPQQIDSLGRIFQQKGTNIGTLIRPIEEEELFNNPNCVKVVINQAGKALYFSRSAIPFPRNQARIPAYQHIGMYAFERKTLLELIQLPPSPLELTESLEQLRWLDHGYEIQTAISHIPTWAVDTPEDLARMLASR